jgi:hypothetical protein
MIILQFFSLQSSTAFSTSSLLNHNLSTFPGPTLSCFSFYLSSLSVSLDFPYFILLTFQGSVLSPFLCSHIPVGDCIQCCGLKLKKRKEPISVPSHWISFWIRGSGKHLLWCLISIFNLICKSKIEFLISHPKKWLSAYRKLKLDPRLSPCTSIKSK